MTTFIDEFDKDDATLTQSQLKERILIPTNEILSHEGNQQIMHTYPLSDSETYFIQSIHSTYFYVGLLQKCLI